MKLRIAILTATVVGLAGPALADRDPTPEERQTIEAMLGSEGFTAWDDIEFDEDDNHWEVDDAVAADGKKWDLKLDPQSMAITNRQED